MDEALFPERQHAWRYQFGQSHTWTCRLRLSAGGTIACKHPRRVSPCSASIAANGRLSPRPLMSVWARAPAASFATSVKAGWPLTCLVA